VLAGHGRRPGRHAVAITSDPLGEASRILTVTGSLYQEATCETVAGLDDVAAVLLIARGYGRHQTEVADQLAVVSEAAEVADLGEQTECCVGRYVSERAEPCVRSAHGSRSAICATPLVEGGELGASRPISQARGKTLNWASWGYRRFGRPLRRRN